MMPPDSDAARTVTNILRRYGLQSLAEWAWGRITGGASAEQVTLEMRDTTEFRTRFRAIHEREQQGLPPISPEEVLQYERQLRQTMRAHGFPEGFYDAQGDAAELLVKDVSLAEVDERASMWVTHAQSSYADDVLDTLHTWGITDGSLAAFAMDPDRAMPLIQRDFAASETAARAARYGFDLTRAEAGRIAETLDPAQAGDRFAALEQASDVLGARLGDQAQGLDRNTMLGIAAADPAALEQADRRVRRARSRFEGDTGPAATREGIGGLGSA